MPYLVEQEKEYFKELVDQIKRHAITKPGDLNYLIAELINQTCKDKSVNYTLFNGIIGALECNKQEVYRKIIAPYEDRKESENGKVWNI